MNTRILILTLFSLSLACSDTVPSNDGDAWGFGEPGASAEPCADANCSVPEDPPPPRDAPPIVTEREEPEEVEPEDRAEPFPLLEGVFVSGHLGQYDGCPEDGLGGPEGDGFTDGDGICDDSQGECGPYACEPGGVVVRLSSVGVDAVLDARIASLDLYDMDGILRAELPILDVYEIETVAGGVTRGDAIESELLPGDERLVHVQFQGPAYPHEFLAPLDSDGDGLYPHSGVVHIHVESSNAPEITILSTPIAPISDIDT